MQLLRGQIPRYCLLCQLLTYNSHTQYQCYLFILNCLMEKSHRKQSEQTLMKKDQLSQHLNANSMIMNRNLGQMTHHQLMTNFCANYELLLLHQNVVNMTWKWNRKTLTHSLLQSNQWQGWKLTKSSSQPQGWLLLKVTTPAQNLPVLIKCSLLWMNNT